MPTAYNALWIIMKQRMKRVNHFSTLTKNVENERMLLCDLSGRDIPIFKMVAFPFWVIFCLLSIVVGQSPFSCHAFVASLPTSCFPRINFQPYNVYACFATVYIDDNSHAEHESESISSQELGLLTFDLDDTLFSINETVLDANTRQLQYMNQVLFSNNCRLAYNITAQDFQRKMFDIRKDLSGPVSYTDLRKLTIRYLFLESERLKDLVAEEVDRYVDNAFHFWLEERHLAAERNLFSDAVATLRKIKEIYPDTCIAAITNGRGDPACMVNSLAPFFDFCISGEDDNVFPNRKPSPKIFDLAIQKYQQLYPHHGTLSKRVWCHVGDCLVNDVGASAACGAFAIWYCPNESSDLDSGNFSVSPVELKRHLVLDLPNPDRTKKIATRVTNLAELPAAISSFLQKV